MEEDEEEDGPGSCVLVGRDVQQNNNDNKNYDNDDNDDNDDDDDDNHDGDDRRRHPLSTERIGQPRSVVDSEDADDDTVLLPTNAKRQQPVVCTCYIGTFLIGREVSISGSPGTLLIKLPEQLVWW
jgi:hypothetical protein